MTTNAIATRPDLGEQIEQVLIGGDLSRLSSTERVSYYNAVCASLGLNPLTKPFEYLRLNGKEMLYAKRDCTEQLRKLHGVSVTITSREVVEDCYVVTARATDRTGRTDESIGVVPIANLKGEARANAMMKGETKAKRRVTLSIAGLGLLDELEVDSIPGAERHGPKAQGDTSSPSVEYAAPLESSPAQSMAKVGVMRLADEVESDPQLVDEYTEPLPIYDAATGEQIGMRPALTSAQSKHIHVLLDKLGHHMDDVRGKERIERGKYRKKLKEKFCKEHTNELSTMEASWAIEWLLRCVAKVERTLGDVIQDTARELGTGK